MTTQFLWDAGTNGYQASLTLAGTADLNGLANATGVLLTGNSSALWTQTNTKNAMLGYVWLTTSATAGWTATAGGNIAGWWELSPDGSALENITATPSRPPDWVISLPAAALSTSKIYASQLTIIPAFSFRTYVVNNSGNTTSAQTDNALTLGLVAERY